MKLNYPEMIRLAPLLLLLLFAVCMAFGVLTPNQYERKQDPMIGTRMPDFSLPLLGHPNQLFLPSLWTDQAVVINLFASWCEPCKAEHPLLMRLATQYGVRIYGIAWRDTEEQAVGYLLQMGNPYQASGVDQYGNTTLLFGIRGVPETLVLDRYHVVRWKYSGPLSEDIVNDTLLPLLKALNAAK